MSDASLLADLAAWREDAPDFHADRALADRVLLATGWRCLPAPDHPAGVKWETGTNPVTTIWEPHHPHPINSLSAAFWQMPFSWRICSMSNFSGEQWLVTTRQKGTRQFCAPAIHATLSVAICIAAVKAWAAREPTNEGN